MKNTYKINRGNAVSTLGWRMLASALLAMSLALAAYADHKISSIVVFGDSLSDTGRLYQLTHGGFPPRVAYSDGRQTNGPVWVEYLADRMNLTHRLKDYAVVGALSGPSAAVPTGNVWSDTYAGLDGTSLTGQLNRYLTEKGGKVDPEALYLIEGGANDLINPLSALLMNPPASTDEFMQAVYAIAMPPVFNIATMTGTLKALGATRIAVVNVPDFGKAPRIVGYGPQASGTVSSVVELVNEVLSGQLDSLDAIGGPKVARIDAFAFIDGVVASPTDFGFTNVTGAFMTLNLGTGKVTYAMPKPHMAKDWFFWDDLHPTTRGHKYFADGALASLRSAFPDLRDNCRDDKDDRRDDCDNGH